MHLSMYMSYLQHPELDIPYRPRNPQMIAGWHTHCQTFQYNGHEATSSKHHKRYLSGWTWYEVSAIDISLSHHQTKVNLQFYTLNCRTLHHKMDELRSLVSTYSSHLNFNLPMRNLAWWLHYWRRTLHPNLQSCPQRQEQRWRWCRLLHSRLSFL